MTAVIGYCMKCKTKRTMSGVKHTTMKNGRPAMTGKCENCDTKMFKIGTGASKKSGVSRKSKKSKKSKKSRKSRKSKTSSKSKKSRKSKSSVVMW